MTEDQRKHLEQYVGRYMPMLGSELHDQHPKAIKAALAEIDRLTEKIGKRNAEIDRRRVFSSGLHSEIDRLKAELHGIKVEQSKAYGLIADRAAEMTALEIDRDKLKAEAAETTDRLSVVSAANKTMSAQAWSMAGRITYLKEQVAAKDKELERLRAELHGPFGANNHLGQLRGDVVRLDSTLEDYRKEIGEYKEAATAWEHLADTLNAKISALNLKIVDRDNAILQWQKMHSENNQVMTQQRANIDQLKVEIHGPFGLRVLLSEANDRTKEAHQGSRKLDSERKARIAVLESQLAALKRDNAPVQPGVGASSINVHHLSGLLAGYSDPKAAATVTPPTRTLHEDLEWRVGSLRRKLTDHTKTIVEVIDTVNNNADGLWKAKHVPGTR